MTVMPGSTTATVGAELLALYEAHYRPGEGVMMGYKTVLVSAWA